MKDWDRVLGLFEDLRKSPSSTRKIQNLAIDISISDAKEESDVLMYDKALDMLPEALTNLQDVRVVE